MFKKFEDIHPSQTAAFADGLLCGIAVAVIGYNIYKARRTMKQSSLQEVTIEDNTVNLRIVNL